MTAATMLMDVSTDFGGGYVPLNADKLERGPVRVRQALSFSLNIPAVKAAIAAGYVDPDRVGLQGHSWGGYQTTFVTTQTKVFKTAIAGAPPISS